MRKKFDLNPYCFAIINEDERYNEFENIDYLKKKLDLDVDYLRIPKLDFRDFISVCSELIKYRCAPIATISYYIHYYISKSVFRKNYKVILSGTGADEIFTGYYDHYLFYLNELSQKKSSKFTTELSNWKKYIQKIIRNPKLDLSNFIDNPDYREHIFDDQKNIEIFNLKNFSKFSEKNYEQENIKNRMKMS